MYEPIHGLTHRHRHACFWACRRIVIQHTRSRASCWWNVQGGSKKCVKTKPIQIALIGPAWAFVKK